MSGLKTELMNKVFEHLTISQIPYLQIVHRLGYPSEAQISAKEKEKIDIMIQKALSIWEPKALTKESDVKKVKKDQILCESILIPSHDVALKFQNSKKITFLALTTGQKVLDYKKDLMLRNEMANSVIMDAVLSELADAVADEIQKQIEREAGLKGFRLTSRYSPGYGDLALDFQETLLDFLEAGKIGISLNKSFLMIPEKSITALIGWIKK